MLIPKLIIKLNIRVTNAGKFIAQNFSELIMQVSQSLTRENLATLKYRVMEDYPS